MKKSVLHLAVSEHCRKKLVAPTALALAIWAPSAVLGQQTDGLEEIIVTAQFRAQNVQETPISITAFSSDMIESRGVNTILEIANTAPNVNLTAGGFGQAASVFIRGVGQSDVHFAVEPGVGVYVDDVYYGVLPGAIFELLDTERVEVLRGPQGTLAGKNSIGGSLKLFSRRPGPDPDGYVTLGYGDYDRIDLKAATNITFVDDKLYARVSAGSRQRNGFVTRLDYGCVIGDPDLTLRTDSDCELGTQGGESTVTGKASLLWTPNDRIENTFSFDFTESKSENPALKQLATITGVGPKANWAVGKAYVTAPDSYTNYEDYMSYPSSAPTASGARPFRMPDITPLHALGFANTFDVAISDSLSLLSITAYREAEVTYVTPNEATPDTLTDQLWTNSHEQVTQELRLSGGNNRMDWAAGFFYYSAEGGSGGRIDIAGGALPLDIVFQDPVETGSKSVFFHSTFHLTENLNLSAGVRYTEDFKDFTFFRYDVDGISPHPTLGVPPFALYNLPVSYEGDNTDYRVAIDYVASDRLMPYFQVSTGYKGGGVSPRPFFTVQATPFNPESVDAYEFGFKSQFLDNSLRVNIAAFYNEYDELQQGLTLCPVGPPIPCGVIANAGTAEIKGVEVEFTITPTPNLLLEFAVGALDFRFVEISPNVTNITLDTEAANQPDLMANVGIQYTFELGNGGSVTPRLDGSYRSEITTTTDSVVLSTGRAFIESRSLANFGLTWRSPTDAWQSTFAITNLTDEMYYNTKTVSSPIGGNGSEYATLGRPREWIMSVQRNF